MFKYADIYLPVLITDDDVMNTKYLVRKDKQFALNDVKFRANSINGGEYTVYNVVPFSDVS